MYVYMPELRVFRGSILRALPVLAAIRADTASSGDILGLYTADILSLCAVLCLALSTTLIMRVIAALKRVFSILPVYSEYDVY